MSQRGAVMCLLPQAFASQDLEAPVHGDLIAQVEIIAKDALKYGNTASKCQHRHPYCTNKVLIRTESMP